jgi:hypothetical protein
MGGPIHRGKKEGGKFVHVYNPPKPWGVWSQILGVVARSEGCFDTTVMYDETGVTAFQGQWTFKSGRLQRLLQFFKSIPYYDFEEDTDRTLFDHYCVDGDGRQVFEKFGFRIDGGRFVTTSGKRLNPSFQRQRKAIVDICMGRRSLDGHKNSRQFALALCNLFAFLGQQPDIQAACVEYSKIEFKRSLDIRRRPLKSVGGTIRCLLPEAVWGSPIPAIFFNLNQNSPGGSFTLFKNAMKTAQKKGLVYLDGPANGYEMYEDVHGGVVVGGVSLLLDIIWRRLCKTKYADWGFGSKQYIESGGKNPPRIKRIRPAIKEFYGIDLLYYK